MVILRRCSFCLIFILLQLFSTMLQGQSKVDSVLVRLRSEPTFPVFDDGTSPTVVVTDIEMEGNAITRYGIITREMVFSAGDTLSLDDLLQAMEKSRKNILNTALFNFVEMDMDMSSFPSVKVNVLLVERWYLWPFPILELGDRNINEWLDDPGVSKMNYGVYLVWDNVRGRRESIRLLMKTGYRHLYTLGYSKPYFNAAKTLGWGMEAGLSQSRELAYMTRDNRQQFVKMPDDFVFRRWYFQAGIDYRPAIRNIHSFRLGYNSFSFADTLLLLNPRFSPGGSPDIRFLSFSWEFKHDFRDLKAYPLEGHYFDFRLLRSGFGLLKKEEMNLTTFQSSYRKFWELGPRWYFAAGANAKISQGLTDVYFNQQGLGFLGDLVRGYEKYVIDGQQFFVGKSNLKYALVPQRTGRIGFLPWAHLGLVHYAFYLNLFADVGYVSDKHFNEGNFLTNTWLGGAGIGLDFVTYYDKVFRTEFSVNRQGEAGLFFHVIAPI